jgi:DNA-3-methyladenine glycosylase
MENWSTNWSANDWLRAKLRGDKTPKLLDQGFYERDTVQVARELLGKLLIVHSRSGIVAGRIVETEAYHGNDPASHSSRGITPRCAVMFGDPGVAYVYFIYGMYEMLNFVTERRGYPGAVLIRAVEPVYGESLMRRRRPKVSHLQLTNGPGRLCQALGIKRSHNGQSLRGPTLLVVDDGYDVSRISASPRVGITAGAEENWRFFITTHPFVSRVAQNSRAVSV